MVERAHLARASRAGRAPRSAAARWSRSGRRAATPTGRRSSGGSSRCGGGGQGSVVSPAGIYVRLAGTIPLVGVVLALVAFGSVRRRRPVPRQPAGLRARLGRRLGERHQPALGALGRPRVRGRCDAAGPAPRGAGRSRLHVRRAPRLRGDDAQPRRERPSDGARPCAASSRANASCSSAASDRAAVRLVRPAVADAARARGRARHRGRALSRAARPEGHDRSDHLPRRLDRARSRSDSPSPRRCSSPASQAASRPSATLRYAVLGQDPGCAVGGFHGGARSAAASRSRMRRSRICVSTSC